jgi:hypothetical protein
VRPAESDVGRFKLPLRPPPRSDGRACSSLSSPSAQPDSVGGGSALDDQSGSRPSPRIRSRQATAGDRRRAPRRSVRDRLRLSGSGARVLLACSALRNTSIIDSIASAPSRVPLSWSGPIRRKLGAAPHPPPHPGQSREGRQGRAFSPYPRNASSASAISSWAGSARYPTAGARAWAPPARPDRFRRARL